MLFKNENKQKVSARLYVSIWFKKNISKKVFTHMFSTDLRRQKYKQVSTRTYFTSPRSENKKLKEMSSLLS